MLLCLSVASIAQQSDHELTGADATDGSIEQHGGRGRGKGDKNGHGGDGGDEKGRGGMSMKMDDETVGSCL